MSKPKSDYDFLTY